MKKTKKFPKKIWVEWNEEDDEPFLVSYEHLLDALEKDVVSEVAEYELVTTVKASLEVKLKGK